jgi:hypothetical protein
VYNKPHPFILLQLRQKYAKSVKPIFQRSEARFIFRHAQLKTPRRREELACGYKLIYSQLSRKLMPNWCSRVFSPL